MDVAREFLEAYAVLFEYPRQLDVELIERCARVITSQVPEVAGDVQSFLAFVRSFRPEELEELYTTTFDGNPECALEIGWHLYGEAYQRGVYLVQMRERLRRFGIEETSELPDHLSHVLRALARSPLDECQRIVRLALLPALAKIEEGLAARSSAYCQLVASLSRAVTQKFVAVSAV